MARPALFVGSSSEGLEFARAVRSLLKDDAEVTIWNEGVFNLGETFIESLVSALPRFDFAVLVLTPDELLLSRNSEALSPRDNVIFELGLFMGRLGRERTFVVRQRGNVVKMPSDLAGVTVATYDWPRTDGSYLQALGTSCDRMREAIRTHGFSPTKVLAHVHAVEAEQQRQKTEIDALAFVVSHLLPRFQFEHLAKLQSGDTFHYEMHPGFERELRHLWEMGFIEKKFDFKILEMAREGYLRDYFSLSEQCKTYLGLRQEAEVRGASG